MDPRRIVHLSGRGGARLALALLALLALPAPGQAAKCDYSGFERPCTVADGEYRVLVPEGEGPFPAMVYLYGSGGRSVTIATHPVFEMAVVQRGYALVVPSAREMTYRPGLRDTGWGLRSEPDQVRDEAAFLRAVIDDAARRFGLDRERILLAGQSRGGFLIWEIACHEPGLASAYAVHAGAYLGALPERCEAPVRFLHTHGLADQVVPFAGRRERPRWMRVSPVSESLALLARTSGCARTEPGAPEPFLGFARQGFGACAPGSRLDLMLHEGGHAMPARWFRAVFDWFEEPLPEAPEVAPVLRRIGEGLPGVAAEPGPAARFGAEPGAQPGARAGGRFKAPPAPGERALDPD